jgi:hypothetical protein
MFIHDIIKIKYVREGYLPNHPYHLISDEEMFDAFLRQDEDFQGFFWYMYPSPTGAALMEAYDSLIQSMQYHISSYKADQSYELPSWVYTYMLGAAVGPKSRQKDIHDIIYPLGVDNIDDDYNEAAMQAVYDESVDYLRKVIPDQTVTYGQFVIHLRPPTMFGEPHVIKSIRMKQSAM